VGNTLGEDHTGLKSEDPIIDLNEDIRKIMIKNKVVEDAAFFIQKDEEAEGIPITKKVNRFISQRDRPWKDKEYRGDNCKVDDLVDPPEREAAVEYKD